MTLYTTRPDDFAAEPIKVFYEALHSIGTSVADSDVAGSCEDRAKMMVLPASSSGLCTSAPLEGPLKFLSPESYARRQGGGSCDRGLVW
jgi:hypothetical protein